MDFMYYFKSRQGEMVRILKELVERESPSQDKKAVDNCSSFIVDEAKRLGARVTTFPQKQIGDIHFVEYPSRISESPKEMALILTHVDTVWPVGKIQKMPFYLSGEKLFGPGVLDMKAGIVMTLFALKTLRELNLKPKKRIGWLINSAEEIGSEESHEIIKKLAQKSAYVLCLEPALPGGGLKVQRKGRLVVRLDTKGKAAHAGSPEKGVSAIEELLAQLSQLKRLKTQSITINVGMIGGGEKPNIVAEHAWAFLDFRFWKGEEKERIIHFLKQMKPALSGAQIKFSVESLTPPMERTKISTNFFQQVKKVASTLNFSLQSGKTGGGSDASIASSLGIPTLDGLGPDGNGIHAENEHLLLPSLVERTAFLTEILLRL